VFAEDDVGRLEVAMDHAARMGVIDRVASIEDAAEELAQGGLSVPLAPPGRGRPGWGGALRVRPQT